MKMTMCKERLCSHTSAAACTAEAASACTETGAQACSLFIKNTVLCMVFFVFMLLPLFYLVMRRIYRCVSDTEHNGKHRLPRFQGDR